MSQEEGSKIVEILNLAAHVIGVRYLKGVSCRTDTK